MCPEFSFVIPVYNTAEYLDEALGSIVGQTIGFEEHAEVILVDDGSEDESLRCCYEWARRHPGRIKVLSRNHQGVCAARNTGFAASKGTWINFMDSDDAWTPDVCASVIGFSRTHPGVALIAARHEFFGSRQGPHPLSRFYSETREIDLDEESREFLLSVNNAFIRRDAVRAFDVRLAIGEDAKCALEILLSEGRYGVLDKPRYRYRIRKDGTSALGSSVENPTFYTVTPLRLHLDLIGKACRETGAVPRFLQEALLYDLGWRFRQDRPQCLSEAEYRQYRSDLRRIRRALSPRVLLEAEGLSVLRRPTCLLRGQEFRFPISTVHDSSKGRIADD